PRSTLFPYTTLFRSPFVFDNEKWAHAVQIRPFAIARAPVTQAEFAAFVDDGGYRQERFWSQEGWRWRQEAGAQHPIYWQAEGPGDRKSTRLNSSHVS